MEKKIELLCPVGAMGMLKAAVSSGADAVYLGMNKFNAREYATNFSRNYLKEAVAICKSNNVKLNLTMNTLVKNSEVKQFLDQIKYAYETGITAVIIQDPGFLEIIKEGCPGLKVHMSTQAGIMNSEHANLFSKADRINLARELSKKNIESIRKNFSKEIEIFIHGALCACVSGSCLFSSLYGGRSGNRGKCAQPCRRRYNGSFPLSTKELCLIERLPEIIEMGIDAVKIEGRMRTPFYVAEATSVYRKAIDSYYKGDFKVTEEMMKRLTDAFSRGFTQGKFAGEKVFNPNQATGISKVKEITYEVRTGNVALEKRHSTLREPIIASRLSSGKKLIVRVNNKKEALVANNYADIIVLDMFSTEYGEVKKAVKKPLYAFTPRIMLDSDLDKIRNRIKEIAPSGLVAGNLGILHMGFNLPVILDYNSNCFNDNQLAYYQKLGAKPIVSPELSIQELEGFKNKDFVVFAHGKIRLMTLAHEFPEMKMVGEGGNNFYMNRIFNGSEVVNERELALLNKIKSLTAAGINQIYLDPSPKHNFEEVVRAYRGILDGKTMDLSGLQSGTAAGWITKGVL